MDEVGSALDPDELMDLDDPDSFDLDDVDEDDIPDSIPDVPEEPREELSSSPFQLHLSSGPGSTATSTASSPQNNTEDFLPPFNFSGKPLNVKRGRGRPKREPGAPVQRRGGGNGAPRVRRAKSVGFSNRGARGSRSVRIPERMDFDFSFLNSSADDSMGLLDPETGGFLFPERERERPPSVADDLPYAPENWPGKSCAFCNLGERSQLGQGEMLRLNYPEGFNPQKNENSQTPPQIQEKDSEDKSPRGPVTIRRTKNWTRLRQQPLPNEHIDELSIIGYLDEPSVAMLFEQNNQFFIHRNCAMWSSGVNKTSNFALENVGPVVVESSSKKCSFCNHYGASLACKEEGCTRIFHFPCATASGAFQELASLTVFCSNHIGNAMLLAENSACYTCRQMGDIANLMYCSGCGAHYHGTCVGLAQFPGVRAGWQCRKCRICQTCRVIGDETKIMTCEHCDKVYHASCQRPIVTSIPKYGWKCRCCRVCGDCGSRTPGAGLSSRWHLHYTVCDSCYQQRNKGCCCPICHRAYRSHAHREMVQCTSCRKFVHGTCDPDADLTTYHQKKDSNPDYEYVCLNCSKNSIQQQQTQYMARQIMAKRSSFEDSGDLSGSQDSLYDDMSEFDFMDDTRNIGLGRGKPFASKIAKKRLGFPTGISGRPKGSLGKGKGAPGKTNFMKRQRLADFGRKRGGKAKIRGMFGAPGVGLQRPTASDGKSDGEEPGVENRLVLCSAKDKFVLTQDICVMCGALGTDHEGMLIACVQCGQCYHPYCISVKVTKVVLQKGWRCLDCTICEGCGQRNDEGRLILCDDCDVSYHTYCMDPPLDYVPHGNWKCKWCACCRTCGTNDPGFNCTWMNGCTECGPCASHTICPSCGDPYGEGDLIIQCCQCERWLHGACDFIKTEQEAEKCAEDGYNCILCRPRDVPPPHLVPPPLPKPPTPTRSPEIKSLANYFLDGVCLSDTGNSMIRSLNLENIGVRKKRKKLPMVPIIMPPVMDKEAGIMATIESVVAGGSSADNSLEDTKIEMVDFKIEEQQELYKEGMIWTKEDGAPPDGFAVVSLENGMTVLRRKRQRNLQKLGIGGFLVRMRGFKGGQDPEDVDMFSGQTTPTGTEFPVPPPLTPTGEPGDKPKRKPFRRKPKSKLSETFPSYLQEAFFGRELMDLTDLKTDVDGASSDDEKKDEHAIRLSADELMAVENANKEADSLTPMKDDEKPMLIPKEEDEDTSEDLKDMLNLPGDLLDTDLVNSIINEDEDSLTKNTELEALGDDSELGDTLGSSSNSKDAKDELSDILNSHFNLESIPNINSKDVEDIFKGVLTDEPTPEPQLPHQEPNMFQMHQQVQPQQQQQSATPSMFAALQQPSPMTIPHLSLQTALQTGPPTRPTVLPGVGVGHSNLNSPGGFPSPSPYHSEYSNSPQFSPAFSEPPPSPWVGLGDPVPEIDSTSVNVTSTYNQRSSEKMKADEGLGHQATISAVLYANVNHPEWKTEHPNWSDRYKQIIKKWRTLSQEQKAPFLQQARDNRSQLRMKKSQQSQTSKQDQSAQSPSSATAVQSSPVKPSTTPTVPAPGLILSSASNNQSVQVCAQPPTAGVVSMVTGVDTTQTSTHQAPIEVCTQPQPTPASSRPPSVGPSSLLTNNNASTITTSTCSVNISSVSVSPAPSPKSPPTHQLFTIKGTLAGPGDRVGPAPNVTVNPNYQPPQGSQPPRSLLIAHHHHHHHNQQPPPQQQQTSNNSASSATTTADQQIRVLTPSEIMRTLPSLCQENYEPPPATQPPVVMDQEKVTHQQKTIREAEQERQWKQLQAMRQQQAQQQQNVIQEQRVQAIARVQRTVSDPNLPFMPGSNQSSPLHVATTPSDLSPAASPSPGSRQFIGMKSPSFLPGQSPKMHTPSSQSPSHDFSQIQSLSAPPTPDLGSNTGGDFSQVGSAAKVVQFAPRLTSGGDPFAQQPGTPSPQFGGGQARPSLQQTRPEQPEIARQLRELLQRQQFKNLDLVPGKVGQRVWPPEGQESQDNVNLSPGGVQGSGDNTFRQPLPPSIARPRLPVPVNVRPSVNVRLQQIDARLQSLDPRMRLILQQQQRLGSLPGLQQGQISGQAIRFGQSTLRPATVEQYEQLLQQRQAQLQQNRANAALGQAVSVGQQPQLVAAANLQRSIASSMAGQTVTSTTSTPATSGTSNVSQGGANDEIPDNVTAELEKLEQETGTMAELQGVSDILGGLGDDDDELLAEMGADFNILEYADPELEALAGEKTNILDLELEEDVKQKKKEAERQKQEASNTTTSTTETSTTSTASGSTKDETLTVSSATTPVTSTVDSLRSQQTATVCQDSQPKQTMLEENQSQNQEEATETQDQSQNLVVSSQQQVTQQFSIPELQQQHSRLQQQQSQLQQQLQLQKQAQMQQGQMHQQVIQQQQQTGGLQGLLQQQQQQSTLQQQNVLQQGPGLQQHQQQTVLQQAGLHSQGVLQQQQGVMQQQQQSVLQQQQQGVLQQQQQGVLQQQQNVMQQQQQGVLQQQQQGVLQQQQSGLLQQQPQHSQQQPQQLTHPAVIQQTQNIHQQMIHQVQQAAAQGRPMPPGAKLTTSDGIVGVVMPNNSVQLQIPANYQQRLLLHLQNQKLQMRLGQQNPRMLLNQQQQQQGSMQGAQVMRPRMAAPPPPPPPYPGPPPPYPGNATPQQMGLRMGPIGGGGVAAYHVHHPAAMVGGHVAGGGVVLHHHNMHPHHVPPLPPQMAPVVAHAPPLGCFAPAPSPIFHHHMSPPSAPHHLHLNRRAGPLLLEDQPLLLEDLLEQEKREQEKQHHDPMQDGGQKLGSEQALLSDHDFERLKADVFNTGPSVGIPTNQGPSPVLLHQPWQQTRPMPTPTPQAPVVDTTPRVPMFQANLRPPPPLPPENIITEQDKQAQIVYEQWLNYQNDVLTQQLKYYETEVQKLRKSRKSLNSKQRQLKKTGGQLTDVDAAELQRISTEQAALQKQLESSRKQMRQHGMLIQEYRNKQQPKQPVVSSMGQSPMSQMGQSPMGQMGQSPMGQMGQSPMGQSPLQLHSPLGPPSASPHHISTSQSPMMSPQQSPLMQHQGSPLHSPSHIVASPGHMVSASPGHVLSHSPGPGSVANLLQSPGSMASSMSPMQPSPRIGTPLSQGEGSPGPAPSPSQVILPPPGPRMTSPQHRRIVTSPVGYTGDIRTGTQQMRFVRTPLDHAVLQQRIRMQQQQQQQQQSAIQNLPPKAGTPSPLNSPPTGQMTPQQLLQKQLHQQALLQQQLNQVSENPQDPNILHSQRIAHLIQQRNLSRQQQVNQQQQQPPPAVAQPQPLTPQQHQLMIQQQQQLKQQQQQLAMQQQARINQQQSQQINPPQSPRQVKSPMISQQIMSPHSSMPASPMPPKSPMVNFSGQNMPSSPAASAGRSPFNQSINQPPSSPMTHQYHPAHSPMMIQSPHAMHRPPSASSSPMPDRPTSVENPSTPRTPYSMDSQSQDSHGGGHPSNSSTPIPFDEHIGGGNIKNSMNSIQRDNSTGGGNPRNPNNPIPLPPPGWVYCKLGLLGGAPMWPGFGRGEKRVPTPPNSSSSSSTSGVSTHNQSEPNRTNQEQPIKREAHITKVSILKRKPSPLVRTTLKSLTVKSSSSSVSSDFSSEYADDNSSGSPATPSSLSDRKILTKQDIDLADCEDDNSTILSSEVSLSSAAQQNEDELELAETLSQNDVGEVLSSPLEPDQISDDFLLFQDNIDMSSSLPYSDNNETEEEYSSENTRIVMIHTPTTSDDEFSKKFSVVEATESEEAEVTTEQSSEAPEEAESSQEFIPTRTPQLRAKSPKEQISTEEDFEQLIDEGSRKLQPAQSQQKFTTTGVFLQQQKPNITTTTTTTAAIRQANVISQTQKLPQKISLITTTPLIQNLQGVKSDQPKQQFILAPSTGPSGSTPKITSLILTQHPLRSNIINVAQKGAQQSSAITIVSANSSHIASILPNTKFTVPVISASDIRKLPNIKVIDKHPSALSLTGIESSLPKKIFEDDSVSPDSNCEEDKKDPSDEKFNKAGTSPVDAKSPLFLRTVERKPKSDLGMEETKSDSSAVQPQKQITTIKTKEKIQRTGPGVNVSSPVILHHVPDLKMTAQVIQEKQSQMHVATGGEMLDEDKSVVISIPSPTPSQEQMLDNLSALENRRRDFDSFEDVLDMIENMQPPVEPEGRTALVPHKQSEEKLKTTTQQQMIVNVTTAASSNVPQLSPLSQPTELTTNMANASQQLRSLLSSFHTTSTSQTSNVESVVKTINQKIISSSPTIAASSIASRVIQQAGRQSPVVTTISTVIVPVPNLKQKLAGPVPIKSTSPQIISSTNNITSTAPGLTFLSSRSLAGITTLADHLKQVASASSTSNQHQATSVITAQSILNSKASVISSTTQLDTKKSLSLTAMLQNQPAATPTTISSADTITAASLLATPISLSRSGFTAALVQAQPNAAIASSNTTTSPTISSSSVITSSPFRALASTTNLLHTQLTKQRTKSLDDIKDIRDLKSEDGVKSEPGDVVDALSIKQEISAIGCKFSSISSMVNRDDSQNVLLKKLLQNTACASTQSPPPSNSGGIISTVAPSVSTPESQKPATPTLSSLLPPTIKSEPQSPVAQPKPVVQRAPIRETSFVSSPVIQQVQQVQPLVASTTAPTQQLHIDIKKCAPPSRTSSRDDLLSPCTPKSTTSQDSSLQTPPLVIKKEFPMGLQGEVKKELLDDNSQHSEMSEPGKTEIKEELLDSVVSEEQKAIDKEELKKQKRRMYAQKRRMNQLLQKEALNKPQKRPRKNSKLEEDYDTYIDGVLNQIRHLPPIVVSEPLLHRNYGVLSVFGSGDMSKIGTKGFDLRNGELTGSFGNGSLPDFTDYYSTVPYGDLEPLPEKPTPSTQRGFYDSEFPLIRFDTEEQKKFDLFSRDDTPDSICTSSSPELEKEKWDDSFLKTQGLKLITDDEEDETEMTKSVGRFSPPIPIVKPIPIRLKPSGLFLKELQNDFDKENINTSNDLNAVKTKPDPEPIEPLSDNGNVTVTLTLTSSAAEDIIGVLNDLANILQIPAPKTYQIVDRTTSPPAKLGLYRTKGKDGKEGGKSPMTKEIIHQREATRVTQKHCLYGKQIAPIDIQSILNGAAKFCKHCDVVILSNMIRKKLSDLPFMAKDSELLSEGDELYFCSSTCYMQFALMHRSPSISEDKAAAIIDHLSQKDQYGQKSKVGILEGLTPKQILANRLAIDQKDIKIEDFDASDFSAIFGSKTGLGQQAVKPAEPPKPQKVHKNVTYKRWAPGCLQPNQKHKKLTDKELMEMLYRLGITVTPPKMPDDTRRCMFCQGIGDGVADGPARLLNFDVDKWVHLNCALWSDGVYETVNGALMNLENAIQQSLTSICIHCEKFGATIRCFKNRCSSVYHLNCAVKDNAVFYKDKSIYCSTHVQKNEKENELTTLSVSRRVYVNRDENRQVAAVMHHSDENNLLRVGSLIFLNVGQILPHQLQNFHTSNYIYPIGYKIIRFYWSMRTLNKRCRYICSINDVNSRPEFKVVVQEPPDEDQEFKADSPKAVWVPILEKIATIRKDNGCLQMFPKYVTGEDLFGLTEPAIVRVLESLPGIETLSDYKFKYGRNPLLELPLAINPSGSARTEPRLRQMSHWKRHYTHRTTGTTSTRPAFGPSASGPSPNSSIGEAVCPYSKQFVHSKSSQYKKMKQEWRNNIYLARSKIQGLGLYAARDLEKHTMVIEYIGEVIRSELAESREKMYEAKNRGIYMFRLDDDRVVDATLSGGLARYINHSCNPNCVAEIVEIDRDLKIIIFAKRRIQRGEELAYDYKFDIEDDQNKISCCCGAPNCRKWMN